MVEKPDRAYHWTCLECGRGGQFVMGGDHTIEQLVKAVVQAHNLGLYDKVGPAHVAKLDELYVSTQPFGDVQPKQFVVSCDEMWRTHQVIAGPPDLSGSKTRIVGNLP